MSNRSYESEVARNFRTQRLIRMGEWLEQNEDALIALVESVDNAHTVAMDEHCSSKVDDTLALETVVDRQLRPLAALNQLLVPLRNSQLWGVTMGEDVTLHQRFACPEHRWEVVIKAPVQEIEQS